MTKNILFKLFSSVNTPTPVKAMFYDRDDEKKRSRFMLYDLSNNYHKDMYVPLGLVTIPKLVDTKWKLANLTKKCIVDDKEVFIGKRFDSEFEFLYETDIKDEMVKEQMKLESAGVRTKRLFEYVEILKKDKIFISMLKKKYGMERKRFIRGYVPQVLSGNFNSEETQKLTDFIEGLGEDIYNQ